MTTARRTASRTKALIDRIESDPRDPRLARIFLVGAKRVETTVGREVLAALGIREGSRWTTQLQSRVRNAQVEREARSHALAMLARASQSAESIRRALLRRRIAGDIVERTVESLVADRWIDEEAHAALRADRLSVSRPGACEAHLSEALTQEGICEQLAQREAHRIAGSAESAAHALSIARTALQRRGRRTALAVAQSLLRRGLDPSIIADAMRREGFDCDAD
jgi:SOS response regulatory protein OraA/RecX